MKFITIIRLLLKPFAFILRPVTRQLRKFAAPYLTNIQQKIFWALVALSLVAFGIYKLLLWIYMTLHLAWWDNELALVTAAISTDELDRNHYSYEYFDYIYRCPRYIIEWGMLGPNAEGWAAFVEEKRFFIEGDPGHYSPEEVYWLTRALQLKDWGSTHAFILECPFVHRSYYMFKTVYPFLSQFFERPFGFNAGLYWIWEAAEAKTTADIARIVEQCPAEILPSLPFPALPTSPEVAELGYLEFWCAEAKTVHTAEGFMAIVEGISYYLLPWIRFPDELAVPVSAINTPEKYMELMDRFRACSTYAEIEDILKEIMAADKEAKSVKKVETWDIYLRG